MKGGDETMETSPVRIDSSILETVRSYKAITGIPMQRFMEEAIIEKIYRLPVDVKSRMGITKSNKKKK